MSRILSILLFSSGLILTACTVMANDQDSKIDNYAECVAAGNIILKTFPPRCQTKDGHIFVDAEQAKPVPKKICVDNCGNGQCEEIVCMAAGCPCPESHEACPKDCQ